MVHPIIPSPPDLVKIDWTKPIAARGGMPIRYVPSLKSTDHHVVEYTGIGTYEWLETVDDYGKLRHPYNHNQYEIINVPEEEWIILKYYGPKEYAVDTVSFASREDADAYVKALGNPNNLYVVRLKYMFKKLYWFLTGRCLKCGGHKVDWRGANVCPKHDFYYNDSF